MTDRETLDRARLLFVGDTQGDMLARGALEIAALSEQQDAWEQAQAEADSASPYSYAVSDQQDKELATLRDQRDELLAMLTDKASLRP